MPIRVTTLRRRSHPRQEMVQGRPAARSHPRASGRAIPRQLIEQVGIVIAVLLIVMLSGGALLAATSGDATPGPPAAVEPIEPPTPTETPIPTETATATATSTAEPPAPTAESPAPTAIVSSPDATADPSPAATVPATQSPTPTPTPTPASTPSPSATKARSPASFSAAATTTLILTLSPASPVVVGTSVRGQGGATYDGPVPTGTMTYTVYASADCSGAVFANAGTFNLVNGTVSASSLVAFPGAGAYSWQLNYSGNATYAAASRCAPLTVTRATPSISLSVSATKNPMRAGGTAKGTATMSGATSTAGGTVTYTVYANSSCSTPLTLTNNPSTVVVANAGVPTSAAISMDVAGTVYWRAAYSGDTNNNAAVSACVSFSVQTARPKLALVVSPAVSPMMAGGTATGAATLTKATSTASGTVTYTVYTASNCSGSPISATNNPSTVTVSNRNVPASAAITFSQVGTFYWRAAYSGDANNNAVTSACIALTVAKTTPGLSLNATPAISPMLAGGTARGVATLSGATATAGGTATYTVYTDGSCTTQLTVMNNPSTVTVTNATVPNSAAITIAQVGTVYWRVVYSGDANNNAAASACVSLLVNKTTPSLSLAVNPTISPMLVGGTASGQAALSGATSAAGGTATYTVYADNTCATPTVPTRQSTKTVTNGSVPPSDLFTFNVAGTVYWQAVYNGDANNSGATSGCVALTISTPGTPTISLTVSPNPIGVGGSATGSATLTNLLPTAGGTVTYTVYATSACTAPVAPAQTSTKPVTAATVPNSGPFTFSQAGAFYWKAVYSGDALNAGAASPCIALTVNKATPTFSLSLSPNPAVAGRTVTGAATLANGVNAPGGTATYTVYTNNTCTTPVTPALTSTRTVTNGTVPNSDALAFNLAGTFYWRVSYSGDANNNPITSLCIALNVTKTTATLSMTQVPSPVNLGDSLSAHFTLSADAVSPTGTVTLGSYGDASCTTAQAGLGPQTVTLVNGQIPDPPAVVYTISTDVYRQASYSGDANNAAATTSCQLVNVAQDLPLGVTLSPATTVLLGASVSAQANWPSDETPTGMVTYTAYATSDCTGAVYVDPQTRTITAGSIAASSARTFVDAGVYSWRAAYSGDDFYNSTSVCTPLTVLKLTPALSLSVAPNPATAGGAVTATSILTGATSTAGGSVIYTVFTDNTCATPITPAQTSTKTVTNGAVPTSDPITMSRAGAFYWQASYTGDPNNAAATSACLALTVEKASPTLALIVAPNPGTAGGTATGTSTLSGAVSAPSGTVTYTVYTGSTCATQFSVTNNPSTKTVTNGTVPVSDPIVFDQAGTYSWKAVYNGDSNNNAAASACVAATVVAAGTAAVALTVTPNPVVVGNSALGIATLSGVTAAAGGTVTYTVYTTATCTTQVTPAQTATKMVTNGAAPNSGPFTFTQVGTVYWQAVYSGDASNRPAASPCVALSVTKASPMLSLTLTPGAIMVWDTATGSATLTDATTNAGGTATSTIYTDNTCATPVIPAQTATRSVVNGAIPDVTFQFNLSGTVYWRVTYSGDANNNGAVGPCLPLTVVSGSLTTSVAAATLPPVNYSTAAQTNSGTLALTVTDQRGTADGWSVSLSISDFAYSGRSPNGMAIPAGAFSITAANAPSVDRGQPIDPIGGPAPPASGATGPLDQPVVVLVAVGGSGAGVYSQVIDVTLTIPANSQTGTYSAVLETVTSAAP